LQYPRIVYTDLSGFICKFRLPRGEQLVHAAVAVERIFPDMLGFF
jgi:hypothetical protein